MATLPTIKLGSKGSAVTLCQQRLNSKGFNIKADGDFGKGTDLAVEQFQASCGLKADGIVGSTTWNYLMAEGQVPTPTDIVNEQRAHLLSKIPANCHPDARKVLEVAISKFGAKEVPEGSNGGPEIAEIVEGPGGDGSPPSQYFLYCGVKDKEVLKKMPPWCCLFVSWSMLKGLGKSSWKEIPFGGWFGGCSQVEKWATAHQKWTAAPVGAAVWGAIPSGAAFTISREGSDSDPSTSPSAGHIGFVICENTDGTVLTIEGNVSSRVGSYNRPKSTLRGYATWW